MADQPLNSAHRNPTIHPGDDFYEYAVGGWCARTPLPPEYSRWGSFEELQEKNLEQIRTILEHPEFFAGTELAPLATKVSALYRLGMDEERIAQEGLAPLRAELDRIEKLTTLTDVVVAVARMHRSMASPLFGFTATPDAKNSSWMIAGLYQGGLGLPDRDYYLESDERFKTIASEYRSHIIRMHSLLGIHREADADTIIALEKKLATVSTSREELRDPHKNYHKLTFAELTELAPQFDWSLFFSELGIAEPESLDVGQLEFFKGLGEIVAGTAVAEWKLYLRWHLIKQLGRYLSAEIETEIFHFEGRVLSGQKEMKPRWKRVIRQLGGMMDMAIGQLFVYKHFSPEAKQRADELVRHLVATFDERIDLLNWMSAPTKEAAHTKLRAIRAKIGYPTMWRDYTALTVDASRSYVENAMAAFAFHTDYELRKINKPVDKEEWFVSPHVINAFYDPLKNEIVFPAGILQPPFFYANADDAVNYGGIGGIIGHELTHGFDDEGRKFDAEGNMREWWTPEDEEKFKTRAEVLVEQFNAYTPIDALHVNGRLTLGENIADLGGITIAYESLMKIVTNPAERIDGLTPAERFFLSWTEGWRHVIAPELAKLYLTIDPHAPGKYRVNGPFSNFEPFYQTFDVRSTHALYRPPEKRAAIW